MQNTVSERINFLRQHHGLSKTDLAKRVGLSTQSIVSLEKRGSASEATIKKIADATGSSVKWIVSGVGQPFTTEINKKTETNADFNLWKETAFETVRRENEHLKGEVQYLRALLDKAIGNLTANFPEPLILPEVPVYRRLHAVNMGTESGATAAA